MSLILELCRQLGDDGWALGEPAFGSAVYFGEIISDDEQQIEVQWPDLLLDIANRWRMFYFHHFMSVALEGMFAWLVTQVSEKGLTGTVVKDLAELLSSKTVAKTLAELLECDLADDFGISTPSDLFQQFVGQFNN